MIFDNNDKNFKWSNKSQKLILIVFFILDLKSRQHDRPNVTLPTSVGFISHTHQVMRAHIKLLDKGGPI